MNNIIDAFLDVLDGSDPHSIQANTGMSLARCREIYEMSHDLRRRRQRYPNGVPSIRNLNTGDYRIAPGGEGPQAADWADKPHRLVYDLCGEIEGLRAATDHEQQLVQAVYNLPVDRLAQLLATTLADRAAAETSQRHFNTAVWLDDVSRNIGDTYSEGVEQ